MKIFLFILIIFLPIGLSAQLFSGEIEYELELIPKHKNVDIDSLRATQRGDRVKYLITNNFYKSTYYKKGKKGYSYSYDNISKRMYDNYVEREYITYRDSRKGQYEYYGSQVYRDSMETVLGLDCFFVDYNSSYGKSRTYYSDQVKVDYSGFEDHKIGNWYEKLKEVDGCLPIKTVTEFEDYIEIRKAVKITRMDLEPSDFRLPREKIIVAAYTALDKRVVLEHPTESQMEKYREIVRTGSKDMELVEDYKVFVSFVVTKNGGIEYIEALEKDPTGMYKVAEKAVKECGFTFTPGKIDGRSVSSLAYFPVEFKGRKK